MVTRLGNLFNEAEKQAAQMILQGAWKDCILRFEGGQELSMHRSVHVDGRQSSGEEA
jgi:hypothetical protein